MNGFHRFPRRLTAVLLVSLGVGAAQAQLNDTGQDKCYDGTNTLATCTNDNTGDGSTYPRQDGRFGRDAAATVGALPPKTGGGAAGFDFTKVCMSGELAGQGSCPDDPTTVGTTSPNDWACTKDNHTNLIWSLESGSGNWTYATTTYPITMDTTNRCGSTGWRAPTRLELLSIVHNGTSSSPTIDAAYFPNTVSSPYWSGDSYAVADPPRAWYVNFNNGVALFEPNTTDYRVRLVRSGQ